MKTIRTILATFGVTSLLYGLFALIAMRLNPAFTGRSIYQLFRDTGFVALVIGIGCVLSFVIMTIAIVSFRDEDARRKHDTAEEDLFDDFLEEETVPEERADEADESWSPEIKRKQRKALRHTEPEPDLFAEDDEQIPLREDGEQIPVRRDEQLPVRGDDGVYEGFTGIRRAAPEEPASPEPIVIPEAPARAATKRCIYCGETIDADSAFCIYCGKRV
ncbi:MAG: hypothetical protein IJK54_04300 [Clostridia bacterium]|nr:hypothetical protein [Clostridia bacterium]